MSYYEYIITGELTPLVEEQTLSLIKSIDEGIPFSIIKYTDETIGEKKQRVLVLASHINMWGYFYNHFKNSVMDFKVYNKQRII